MALEWIQENIHSFEGNPKSVTIMGHSAGAGATHILALSKKTEGLFHRYILLSGSALAKWSVHPPKRYRQVCLKLAEFVGCLPGENDTVTASNETTTENPMAKHDTSYSGYTAEDDEEIMKCMRMVDARILETKTRHFVSAVNRVVEMFGVLDGGSFALLCARLSGGDNRGVNLVPRWRMTRRTPS